MRQRTLQRITPLFYDDNLIVSLSKKWIEYFGKIPDFEVILEKNGKLLLRSRTAKKEDKV